MASRSVRLVVTYAQDRRQSSTGSAEPRRLSRCHGGRATYDPIMSATALTQEMLAKLARAARHTLAAWWGIARIAAQMQDIERLPPTQQAVASAVAGGEASTASVQGIDDPLSRLIAAALLFQAGKANPATITLAADTASAQGWRRPLLAWLEVLALRADRAGAVDEAQRLRRQMLLVQGAK